MVRRVLILNNKNKMKKIYLKNGKEVHLGDILTKVSKVNDPFFGKDTVIEHVQVKVTKDILPKLFYIFLHNHTLTHIKNSLTL